MRLYLVQHGHALPKDVDPKRPLSDDGRADVERMALQLGQAGVQVARVLHSSKERARQTAERLAASVGARVSIGAITGIAPLDPTDEFARVVDSWIEDTMVVGHLPFMAKLVSRLAAGDESVSVVRFQPGAVVCLERVEEGGWLIAWMIRPMLAAAFE